ncbi:ECF RNA polymerase sigma factor SigW [bacterium HR17]|uniref:RNA polymerase sigma factor n=1 Tax=Candidatus Fervidibacter japonicus TaxID=2035412 RepID=A0A2H5XG90_9BACT|nr:ECF RNA polymerase sigma factor SigW [bacterium HR17]
MVAQKLTDGELVRQAKAGDLSAFEELVNRYERRIWTLAKRIVRHDQDAEDVTQDTFLTALEHLDELREEERFGAWLVQIATRHAFRVLERRKRLPTQSLDELTKEANDEDEETVPHPEFIADWRENPETLLLRAETRQLIEQALSELPEKYRSVFLLRDVEGLSVKETAEALGISEANVKVRLLRARLQLREKLTRWFGDEAKRVMPHRHDAPLQRTGEDT